MYLMVQTTGGVNESMPAIRPWGSISFCPDIPSVSQYTFLGLYTCIVGTSFREICLSQASVAAVRMPKPIFRMSNKAFHSCTTAQGTLFSAWDTTIKIDCASQHSEFWGETTYRGLYWEKMGVCPITDPNARSWIVTSGFTRKIAQGYVRSLIPHRFH